MYLTPSLIHGLEDMERFEQGQACINTTKMWTALVQPIPDKIMLKVICAFPDKPEKLCIVGFGIILQQSLYQCLGRHNQIARVGCWTDSSFDMIEIVQELAEILHISTNAGYGCVPYCPITAHEISKQKSTHIQCLQQVRFLRSLRTIRTTDFVGVRSIAFVGEPSIFCKSCLAVCIGAILTACATRHFCL